MVTVYTKPNCPQCISTKKMLTRKGIEFSTIDVTEDSQAYQFVVDHGFNALPVVDAGSEMWSGFRFDNINKLAEQNS